MSVTRAAAFGDPVRPSFTRWVDGEVLENRRRPSWHRRIFSWSGGAKWMLSMISIVGLGCADFATGSAESFSLLYLAPIAFATWFIRPRAGLAMGVLAACIWLGVELALNGGRAIAATHVFTAVMRFAMIGGAVALLAFAKNESRRQARVAVTRARSFRVEVARCRRLEREIVTVASREQLRLAQDLHDGVGQYLSALTFISKMLADDLNLHDSAQAPLADRVVELVRKTNQVTRQMNRALKIPDTQGGGLAVALRTLATDVEELTGVHCVISTDREVPMLDEFRTMMLFRIAQEAFNNGVKHARPRSIRVSLTFAKQVLFLTVVNDGHDPASAQSGETGTGSRVMRQRAEHIGAQLDAGPVSATEYQVRCALPLERPKAYAVAS